MNKYNKVINEVEDLFNTSNEEFSLEKKENLILWINKLNISKDIKDKTNEAILKTVNSKLNLEKIKENIKNLIIKEQRKELEIDKSEINSIIKKKETYEQTLKDSSKEEKEDRKNEAIKLIQSSIKRIKLIDKDFFNKDNGEFYIMLSLSLWEDLLENNNQPATRLKIDHDNKKWRYIFRTGYYDSLRYKLINIYNIFKENNIPVDLNIDEWTLINKLLEIAPHKIKIILEYLSKIETSLSCTEKRWKMKEEQNYSKLMIQIVNNPTIYNEFKQQFEIELRRQKIEEQISLLSNLLSHYTEETDPKRIEIMNKISELNAILNIY